MSNIPDTQEIKNANFKVDNQDKLSVKLDVKKRIYVFIVLSVTSVLINMDHGTIPAASNEIMNELKIQEATLGTFGSLVYLGNLIGALFLIKLIDYFSRRKIFVITLLCQSILIFTFTKVTNLYYLFLNRMLVGVMQSYIAIYFPVWVDQFGMRSWKTLMMAIFNITSPLGVVIGFILTMTLKVNFNVSELSII